MKTYQKLTEMFDIGFLSEKKGKKFRIFLEKILFAKISCSKSNFIDKVFERLRKAEE